MKPYRFGTLFALLEKLLSRKDDCCALGRLRGPYATLPRVVLRPEIARCPSVVPLDKRLGEAQARGWAVVGMGQDSKTVFPNVNKWTEFNRSERRGQ
jgi:hypothetical protein